MNRIEYEHAVKKAKAARVWQNRDPNDPAARLAFERDCADPIDDARGQRSEDLDDERCRQRQLRENAEGSMRREGMWGSWGSAGLKIPARPGATDLFWVRGAVYTLSQRGMIRAFGEEK